MKFRYTILISGTNGAVQKDIEADNISKATITAKARVREIWGLTAKLKQKVISREKDFYKDEYYSQNKETGRYKKEFVLIVKALNKTQDSGSRVFDRLFKVLDKVQDYSKAGQAWARIMNEQGTYKVEYNLPTDKVGINFKGSITQKVKEPAEAIKYVYQTFKSKIDSRFYSIKWITQKEMAIINNETGKKVGSINAFKITKANDKRPKIGDEVKRFIVPKTNINTLSYILGSFLENNEKSKSYQFGNNKGFSYTLTFQRLSKDSVRVIYKANKQSFSMVLSGIYKNTNETKFAEKIAQKVDAINSLKGI